MYSFVRGIKQANIPAAQPKRILDRLYALDTNTLSDALDFLGLKGATVGIRPLWGSPKVVGRACTVQLAAKSDRAPTAHLISPVIDAVEDSERVLVVAGGIDGVSCWGDILANAARIKRIRGTIIDGYSRDIKGSMDIGYPVFGRGITMVSVRNRLAQIESGSPFKIAGVTVQEGDYVIADVCGTVFIPQDKVNEVLDLGERIDRRLCSRPFSLDNLSVKPCTTKISRRSVGAKQMSNHQAPLRNMNPCHRLVSSKCVNRSRRT